LRVQRTNAANALIASVLIKAEFLLDLTDFKRDLSELTDRLGHAQDCL
jgi:peptide chain release factor 2